MATYVVFLAFALLITTQEVAGEGAVAGFSQTSFTVTEGVDRSLTITILRSGDLYVANLTIFTVPGTAKAGSDYTPISENIITPSGKNETAVVVFIVDDLKVEENETFSVSLESDDPTISVDPSKSRAEVTIIDDGCEFI
jgi:hypothetical protein